MDDRYLEWARDIEVYYGQFFLWQNKETVLRSILDWITEEYNGLMKPQQFLNHQIIINQLISGFLQLLKDW